MPDTLESCSMKRLGFLTNIYSWNGVSDFDVIVGRANRLGFDSLELGPAVDVNETTVRSARDAGLSISNLIYCRNLLTPNHDEAATYRTEAMKRIAQAAEFEIPLVVLCAGYADPCADLQAQDSYATIRRPPIENIDPFLAVYGPLIEEAEKQGVKIAFEHCPVMGNWLISPYLWSELFSRLDSASVGICFDPSHLVWQFIDAYAACDEFAERIFHVHAKDTEIFRDRLARRGVLTDFAWWENRLPGFGELNWIRLLALLETHGYGGVVSIEHEDPTWNGSLELVDEGLSAARDHLRRSARAAQTNAALYDDSATGVKRIARQDGSSG